MEVTENRKLIYQLYLLKDGPREYLNNPFLPCHESYNIWVKRAYKKGYVNLVSDNKISKVYELNNHGEELLKKYPELYLQKKNYMLSYTSKRVKGR